MPPCPCGCCPRHDAAVSAGIALVLPHGREPQLFMLNCATRIVIRAIRLSAAIRRACRLGSCRIPASAASRPWWGDATGLSRPVSRRDSRLVSVPRSSAKEARCCRLVPRRAGSRPVLNSEFSQLESAKRTNSAAIWSKLEEPVEAMEQGGLMSAS